MGQLPKFNTENEDPSHRKKGCQNVLVCNALMMHSAISSLKILFDNFRLELILVLSFKLSTYYTYLGAFEN